MAEYYSTWKRDRLINTAIEPHKKKFLTLRIPKFNFLLQNSLESNAKTHLSKIHFTTSISVFIL